VLRTLTPSTSEEKISGWSLSSLSTRGEILFRPEEKRAPVFNDLTSA
jgi:hypothetical protein